jgi:hypothetical protein
MDIFGDRWHGESTPVDSPSGCASSLIGFLIFLAVIAVISKIWF